MKNKKFINNSSSMLPDTDNVPNPWYQGNLKGINDLAFELNIKV